MLRVGGVRRLRPCLRPNSRGHFGRGCVGAHRAHPARVRGATRRARTRVRSGLTAPAGKSSAVPDVLGPSLEVVFCGINPGRWSGAHAAHFANPRNDFWRALHAAGFTPRLYAPGEQYALLALGLGITNAAYRTTPGSGDLRRADFAGAEERLRSLAVSLAPRAIAFVGKEAYRGAFGERPEHGLQARRLGEAFLFVLPSTSPANAAVPWEERLRWFRTLRALVSPSSDS